MLCPSFAEVGRGEEAVNGLLIGLIGISSEGFLEAADLCWGWGNSVKMMEARRMSERASACSFGVTPACVNFSFRKASIGLRDSLGSEGRLTGWKDQ